MRRMNKRFLNMLLTAVAQSGAGRRGGGRPDIYTTVPANLRSAEGEVARREQEWKEAGAVKVVEPEVDQAHGRAKGLQSEFDEAKRRSRRSLTLRYLNVVRLFVLTGLPRCGKPAVIGVSAAIICAVSLVLSPFLFPSSCGSAAVCALVLAAVGSCLAAGVIWALWPTDAKRQAFNRLLPEWKGRKEQVDNLRPKLEAAWEDYRLLRQQWEFYGRLEEARRRRDEIAALLSSLKYQLIHTDWRSMRGTDFEHFLSRVFQSLGYQVTLTKGSGDQGVDLILTGKGRRIAVQAKGYAGSLGNSPVQEVVAGMVFYQCDSCAAITNSRFTSGAEQLAAVNGCKLIDGARIPDLIEGRIY